MAYNVVGLPLQNLLESRRRLSLPIEENTPILIHDAELDSGPSRGRRLPSLLPTVIMGGFTETDGELLWRRCRRVGVLAIFCDSLSCYRSSRRWSIDGRLWVPGRGLEEL